jgi:hypothetical protein
MNTSTYTSTRNTIPNDAARAAAIRAKVLALLKAGGTL